MTWLRQIPGVREIEFDGETLPRTNDLIIGTGLAASYDPATRKTTLATNASGLPAGTATYQPLTWNGTAWLGAALNLAQAAAVTGVLAVANGGTGLAALGAANTVLKVNAGGVANEYGKLTTANLDAAAGILGSQLAAAAGIVGTQLAAGANIAASQLAAGAAGTVMIGGASNSFSATPNVTSVLCGASADAGFTVAATVATFGKSVASPGITQTARDSDAAPQSLTLTPQAPWASATGANRTPGSLLVNLAAPTNSGTAEAFFTVRRASVTQWLAGAYPNAPSAYSALYGGPAVVPASGNFILLATNISAWLNTPDAAGTLTLANGNSTRMTLTTSLIALVPPTIAWALGVTAPTLTQSTPTTDVATANLTVQAQGAYASATGANVHGGHLLLRGGAEKGAAAGKKGGVRLQLNATTETMLEVTEVAIGQRVVAICRGSDLTTTQMPAGTGDRVVYIENAATARSTGTPVGGGMLEVVGGDAFWINEAGVRNQIN